MSPDEPARPDAFEIARRALLGRPRFTVRSHLVLTAAVVFVLFAAVLALALAGAPDWTVAAGGLLAGAGLVLGAVLLDRRIVVPIRRFRGYVERIGAGNQTPVMPARRHRDEFTTLALGVNEMLKEIERRQDLIARCQRLQAVGMLTAGVAHELSNPLNNISLTAHALREARVGKDTAERDELLDDLVRESERTRAIVENLLDFARKAREGTSALALPEVLSQALALSKNHLAIRRVSAEFSAAKHLPPILGDRHQLVQVFVNLILNAADASPAEGRVLVAAVRDADPKWLLASVEDHGAGIPENVRPHLFDPFFTTKPSKQGTGLGLWISKSIVERHGGEILLATEPGRTVFTVRLPAFSVPLPPAAGGGDPPSGHPVKG